MVLISSAPQATNSAAIEISVPLRGLWFLSQLDTYLEGYTPTEFPSPCGDYGSYLLTIITSSSLTGPFRPLAGIMVLISPAADIHDIVFRSQFRPLAGIMVLIV